MLLKSTRSVIISQNNCVRAKMKVDLGDHALRRFYNAAIDARDACIYRIMAQGSLLMRGQELLAIGMRRPRTKEEHTFVGSLKPD